MKIRQKTIGKILFWAFIVFFIGGVCFADEVQEQEVKNDQTYFTANLQKQPQQDKHKQGISNHFTFFTINVQINGKMDDIPTTDK